MQGHRYDIYENVGCIPTLYNTWMAYPMVHMWPIIIGLVSGIYCGSFIFPFISDGLVLTSILHQLLPSGTSSAGTTRPRSS